MKYRYYKSQQKKKPAKPDSEFRQHRGGLCAKKIIGQPAAKSCTEAFTLGTLHENRDDHQKADEYQESYKNIYNERHSHLLEPEAFLL